MWLLLFSILAAVSTDPSFQELALLFGLGLFQVIEGRLPFLATDRGVVVSLATKLLLCYLLIGFTFGISSTYYLTLMLPVVSAATVLSLAGTMLVTAIACLEYLSFLLFLDWKHQELTREALGELGLRVGFLPVVGFLTQQLAEANRAAARKYQAVAQQLESASRNLQTAEAAIRRSDRLAALGQLTAGLAHELRNPLGTMRASAELLLKNLPPDNAISQELAGFIASEVDRTNSLITRFLEFARPLQLRLELADVTKVVDQAIAELHRHSPPLDVSVHRNYSPDLPLLRLDTEWMQRVFYNLLLNAAQASQDSGAITVKVRQVGSLVEAAVIDRGCGIAQSELEHIFNPFFTTKRDGVGLGLAIVAKIVDEHRGKITVESEPSAGSVFRVFLPMDDTVVDTMDPSA